MSICEFHFRTQHIETGYGLGLETTSRICKLLLKQANVLLLNFDTVSSKDDIVIASSHLRQYLINSRTQVKERSLAG
ncbi:MAG: hypothetical protein BWY82_01009 [Verrucomicrobia bacterium ADurb.Bin474]|nr:MAG: hypothetical protein BWY82_01009 [Verrucomicrobia bacterium ADurb.Bin474]